MMKGELCIFNIIQENISYCTLQNRTHHLLNILLQIRLLYVNNRKAQRKWKTCQTNMKRTARF
jgi:hypothetical protein